MLIDFYLENIIQNKIILLPVTPENYEATTEIQIETVKLASVGDINIPTFLKPKAISIDGIFSVNQNYKLNSNLVPELISNSVDYLNVLNEWQVNKDIIRVVIVPRGTAESRLDAKFYIQSLKITGENESTGDIAFTIDFVEYKEVGANTPKEAIIQRDVFKESTPAATPNKTYTVVKGDSLYAIARKFYGNGNEYNKIATVNNIKNPNLIHPGQVLVIS